MVIFLEIRMLNNLIYKIIPHCFKNKMIIIHLRDRIY